MASEFMRVLDTEDYSSVGELERKLQNSANFFNQVLVSPLHDAAARGNLGSLKEILESEEEKKTIYDIDNAKNTPLHWAAGSGNLDIVLFLLKTAEREGNLESFINMQNLLGDTALHRAVWRGHLDVVRCLLDHGVDRDILNTMHQPAIQLVRDTAIGCLLQNSVVIPGIVPSSDDECDGSWSDEGSFELNLSDTSFSEEDEDIGVMLVEQRMNRLFQSPDKEDEKEELKQSDEDDIQDDEDDDLPPELVDND